MNDALFSLISARLEDTLREVGAAGKVTPDTVIFGRESPLDSTQLVSFIVDVEEALFERFGVELSLADRRAMSREQSPFRSVSALCGYVGTLLKEAGHEI